jgi:hypothetical protein
LKLQLFCCDKIFHGKEKILESWEQTAQILLLDEETKQNKTKSIIHVIEHSNTHLLILPTKARILCFRFIIEV